MQRVRSDRNLIILVAESCDYRVSGANQGFACHSFDQRERKREKERAGTTRIPLICVPRNLVRSRWMLLRDDPVRLGVNDRIAIIRARLITRTAFIPALLLLLLLLFSPPSTFLLRFFPLVPLLTRSARFRVVL